MSRAAKKDTISADVREEFDKLQTGGVIGDPRGELAYAYIRVSSVDQSDDGRSGLPRQVQAVHEVARAQGYAVPWEMVFAEDHSGFEFRDRLVLKRLRAEYKAPRGSAVLMEHIDRLSRNVEWHQGYLLDEMQQSGLKPVFWKAFSSRIERMVMGAVAQDGMERSKEIMHKGTLDKARSGRVTARTAAYGYRIVDDHGVEADKSTRARRMTYYAIHEAHASVIRMIYERVAAGQTLRTLAEELHRLYAPPKTSKDWNHTQIRLIIKNPVYKGEFAAHRTEEYKRPADNERGYTINRRTRPPEEWIIVPVPAIVDAGLWQAANDMIAKNKVERGRHQTLLAGFLKCAECGYSVVGRSSPKKQTSKRTGETRRWQYYGYQCSVAGQMRSKAFSKQIGCKQGQIAARKLDAAVWGVVLDMITRPDALLQAIDNHFSTAATNDMLSQIHYLEDELDTIAGDDEKLFKAYMAEVFSAEEYRERRHLLKARRASIAEEIADLRARVVTPEQIEQEKATLMSLIVTPEAAANLVNAPDAVKRRVLKLLVTEIRLNVREGWFEMEGKLSGRYKVTDSPADMGSWPKQAENLQDKSSKHWHD